MEPPPELAASSTDDLLAQMADEAIDRLIAEADKGAAAVAPPPPIEDHPPADQSPVAEVPPAVAAPEAASEPVPVEGDEAMSAAEQAVADLLNPPEPEPEPAPVAEQPAPAAVPTPTPQRESAPVPNPAAVEDPVQPVAVAMPASDAEAPPAPAADVRALLQEAPAAPSPLLLPLRVINSPFAFLSDDARRTLGLIGIVTLVPALCAIAYVLYFKHHW